MQVLARLPRPHRLHQTVTSVHQRIAWIVVLPVCEHTTVLTEAAAGIQVSRECLGASMVNTSLIVLLGRPTWSDLGRLIFCSCALFLHGTSNLPDDSPAICQRLDARLNWKKWLRHFAKRSPNVCMVKCGHLASVYDHRGRLWVAVVSKRGNITTIKSTWEERTSMSCPDLIWFGSALNYEN